MLLALPDCRIGQLWSSLTDHAAAILFAMGTAAGEELLEAVRARLRGHAVKLWLPPYCVEGRPKPEAVVALLPTVFAERGGSAALAAASDAALVQSLTHLQKHAIKKLHSRSAAQSTSPAAGAAAAPAAAPATAPATTTVLCKVVGAAVPRAQELGGPRNTLVLPAVPLAMRASELGRMVLAALFGDGERERRERLRLFSGGRQLAETDPIVRNGVRPQTRDGTLSVLAIVSEQQRAAGDAGSGGAHAGEEDLVLQKARKIRDAAALLATRDFHGDFELTDQHGRAVALPPQERAHLCAALALHTLGKKVLSGKLSKGARGKEASAGAVDMAAAGAGAGAAVNAGVAAEALQQDALQGGAGASDQNVGALCQRGVADALAVLLESDAAWSRVSETWKQRVDNFGLLQLEIVWCHLNLEQLSALPDAAARIKLAETVLLKQVNPNFLKLAIMNAEEGRPVPPLAAPFVRLLLLQGVIHLVHERNVKKAIQTLGEARVLCKSPRSALPTGHPFGGGCHLRLLCWPHTWSAPAHSHPQARSADWCPAGTRR